MLKQKWKLREEIYNKMAESCLNCGKSIEENYCGNCGQKRFSRIDRKYIFSELENTVLQTNKGFLFSVKSILKNPGKTAKEFINGSRINPDSNIDQLPKIFLFSNIRDHICCLSIFFQNLLLKNY